MIFYHGGAQRKTEKLKGMDSYFISFLWDTDFTDLPAIASRSQEFSFIRLARSGEAGVVNTG
jgi:hypothetical protein